MASQVSQRDELVPNVEDDDSDESDDEDEPVAGKKKGLKSKKADAEEETRQDYTVGDMLTEQSRQEQDAQGSNDLEASQGIDSYEEVDTSAEEGIVVPVAEVLSTGVILPGAILAPDGLSWDEFDEVGVVADYDDSSKSLQEENDGWVIRDPKTGQIGPPQPDSAEEGAYPEDLQDYVPIMEVETLDEEEDRADQEPKASIRKLEIERKRVAKLVAYHPGKPNGKLFLLEKITETMDYGRQEGWYTDLDTYENVLNLLCEDPEQAVLAQDILNFDLLVSCLPVSEYSSISNS